MEIFIQKASITEDAQKLFTLDRAVENTQCYLPARSVEEESDFLRDSKIYVAYDAEKAIGFVAFKPVEDFVEVQAVVVAPIHQHKGVGKQLMTTLLEVTEGKELRLVTHPHNTNAIIYYLKSGFVIDGWAENYYGDGEPRLKLARKP